MVKNIDNKGFTLVEVLIAMLLLVVALLGLASVATSVINGNGLSKEVTTATTLAQDKIEELKKVHYQSLSDGSDTSSIYTRTWTVTTGFNMKTVDVAVTWNRYGITHNATLTTIVAY
jgi:type IV pilus assembly protein PilV